MGKEIILKGYVSEDGTIGEGNTTLSSSNNEDSIIKLVKDVVIRLYSSDKEVSLQEIQKSEPKHFTGKVQLSITIQDDGAVSFIIENQELEKHTKDYIGKYVCVLIQIKE